MTSDWHCALNSGPTKSGPRGANTVGEEHLQMWHVLNVQMCILLGKELKGLINGLAALCSLFPLTYSIG